VVHYGCYSFFVSEDSENVQLSSRTNQNIISAFVSCDRLQIGCRERSTAQTTELCSYIASVYVSVSVCVAVGQRR